MITPDLIVDEADEWLAATTRHDLAPIFLVAPSSPAERIALTTSACRGFVYAAAVMGTTGVRESVSAGTADLVARCRAHTALPVGVGLGVRTGEQAAQIASFADAVIVGSALVTAAGSGPDAVRALAGELAAGVRRASASPSAPATRPEPPSASASATRPEPPSASASAPASVSASLTDPAVVPAAKGSAP